MNGIANGNKICHVYQAIELSISSIGRKLSKTVLLIGCTISNRYFPPLIYVSELTHVIYFVYWIILKAHRSNR